MPSIIPSFWRGRKMSTSYNAQLDNKHKEYSIQFKTNNYEYFKFVERACQKAVDKNDKAIRKERCSEARVLGHL